MRRPRCVEQGRQPASEQRDGAEREDTKDDIATVAPHAAIYVPGMPLAIFIRRIGAMPEPILTLDKSVRIRTRLEHPAPPHYRACFQTEHSTP